MLVTSLNNAYCLGRMQLKTGNNKIKTQNNHRQEVNDREKKKQNTNLIFVVGNES